jgi:hypothetical protein
MIKNVLTKLPFAVALIAVAGCPDKEPSPDPFDTSVVPTDTDDTAVSQAGCRATYGGLGFTQPVTFNAVQVDALDASSPCYYSTVALMATGTQELHLTFDDSVPDVGADVVITGLGVHANISKMAYCQDILGDPLTTFTLTELTFPTLPYMTIKLTPDSVDASGQIDHWTGYGWCDTINNLGDPSDPFSFPTGNPSAFARYHFERVP